VICLLSSRVVDKIRRYHCRIQNFIILFRGSVHVTILCGRKSNSFMVTSVIVSCDNKNGIGSEQG